MEYSGQISANTQSNVNKQISRAGHPQDTWYVLIVDDDIEVHDVTRLSLHNIRLLGRRVKLFHAMSGAEAKSILQQEPGMAVVLLDVVMEQPDAGLRLVQTIRDELRMQEVRIILRTGQPGYAPEEKVIHDYDINDYKTKQDLTHTHLITSMVACLRSYQQIKTINQNRAGLQKIIAASSNLLEIQSIQAFSDGVITQIASLLGLSAEGLMCAVLQDQGNDAATRILGAAGQYADLNQQSLDLLEDSHRRTVIRRCLDEQQHLYLADETVLYIGKEPHAAAIYLHTSRPIEESDRELIELFLKNISIAYQNVSLFQKLSATAFADPLTRLANRNEFIRLLHETRFPDGANPVVVLLDLKHFSEINDGLGQDVGDDLLRAVARRLQLTFGQDTAIARIDADVFGLIGDETILNPLSILASFDTPFESGDQQLLISATLGIGQLELMGEAGLTRLKRAYIALNAAKRSLLSNYAYYVPKMEEDTEQRLLISRALRDALARRQLQVWYQPQFDLSSREVTGVEALLRWPQNDGDFIPPSVFIPIAEHSGLIVDIGFWVIDQVCSDLAELSSEGFPNLRSAINISMQQFRSPSFISGIMQSLSNSKIDAARIELEITESVLMDEPEVVIKALRQLKQLGITISIDDFGTGFSSLSYLRHLPLDRMKVDRSFVRDINQPGGHVIIESILSLGHQLGLRTIAEGIETAEQETFVRKHGCHEGQGYLYAQAMPLEALKRFIEQRRTPLSGAAPLP
ncbi:MAG: EAL domain-containing protein [Pseudohongiella sp.]|nr:EAL domain-containing protein [Pseudohongiella sp.]MDP2127951.1 EAL domain-containing protein [Pseudohongiella sp.]